MSTNLPTQDQALQAQSYMLDRIHVPAFFEKLAAHGVEPRNDAEAKQLLQLGAVLAEAAQQGQVKQASAENPFLTDMLQRFAPQSAPNVDDYVKQSADQLVGESELARNAALIYAHTVSGGELADEQPAAE